MRFVSYLFELAEQSNPDYYKSFFSNMSEQLVAISKELWDQ